MSARRFYMRLLQEKLLDLSDLRDALHDGKAYNHSYEIKSLKSLFPLQDPGDKCFCELYVFLVSLNTL